MRVLQATCLPSLTTSPITSASLLETSISKILLSDIMPHPRLMMCGRLKGRNASNNRCYSLSHQSRDSYAPGCSLPFQVCSGQNAASTWREEGGFPAFSPSSAAHTVVGGAAFVLGGWDSEHKVEMVDQYIMYHEGASSHGV